MKLCTKICIWLGALLLAAGVVLFVCGMAAKNWDFGTLSTLAYEQKEFSAQNEITEVRIDFKVSEIRVVQSKDVQTLTCSYPIAKDLTTGKSAEVNISEENGVLSIAEKSLSFSLFQWNAGSPALVLTLPQNVDGLAVYTDVGDIELEGLTGGKVQAETDVGDILCRNVQAEEISLLTDLGNVTAENCTVEGTFTIGTDTGDIRLKDLSAECADASANLGDITLQGALTAKEVRFETDSGDIDLAEGKTDAETLSFSTSLGDISATLTGAREDYAADVEWDLGDTNLYPSTGGTRTLIIRSNCGDIEIGFTK